MASAKVCRPEPPVSAAPDQDQMGRRKRLRPVVVAALILLPWLLLARLAWWTPPPRTTGDPAVVPAAWAPVLGKTGDWGQLETVPITISPPIELIPDDPRPIPSHVDWHFAQTSREDLGRWLVEAGLPDEDAGRVLATARPEPPVSGVRVSVDLATVKRMSAETRARVYMRLAQSPLNPRQENAYRFYGSVDEWLRSPLVSARTLEVVRPPIYSNEGFQLFADVEVLRAEVPDRAELRRMVKMLLREKTILVRLRLPEGARFDAAAGYWARGGRMTDIRPILESVASQGGEASIDVLHLLPAFARRHLYRYPQITLADLEQPGLDNCFWSAMNFFNRRPYDDRFLKLEFTLSALKNDYYLVHDNFQLGDIVLFSNGRGGIYHAAVHVADGIIFGKNGSSSLAPWTVLPIERIFGYYPQHAPGGTISYYRRTGL